MNTKMPHHKSKTRYVLHVEDDPFLANAVARYLQKKKFEVISETTAIEGVKRFQSAVETWSAVIMDLALPDVNGATLFKTFREHRPSIPILVLSGDISDSCLLQMEGAAVVLAKPVVPEDLVEALEALISFPLCKFPIE